MPRSKYWTIQAILVIAVLAWKHRRHSTLMWMGCTCPVVDLTQDHDSGSNPYHVCNFVSHDSKHYQPFDEAQAGRPIDRYFRPVNNPEEFRTPQRPCWSKKAGIIVTVFLSLHFSFSTLALLSPLNFQITCSNIVYALYAQQKPSRHAETSS